MKVMKRSAEEKPLRRLGEHKDKVNSREYSATRGETDAGTSEHPAPPLAKKGQKSDLPTREIVTRYTRLL